MNGKAYSWRMEHCIQRIDWMKCVFFFGFIPEISIFRIIFATKHHHHHINDEQKINPKNGQKVRVLCVCACVCLEMICKYLILNVVVTSVRLQIWNYIICFAMSTKTEWKIRSFIFCFNPHILFFRVAKICHILLMISIFAILTESRTRKNDRS